MNIHEPMLVNDNPTDDFTLDDLTLESIDETARLLGCARRTIYTLIERGDLRSVHIGRRHLIPRGERLRFVRDQLNAQ